MFAHFCWRLLPPLSEPISATPWQRVIGKMGNNIKRHTLCLLIAAGGCVAGAYSAYAAYENGKLISAGSAGVMFGLAFGAVVVVSWLMLPWADKRAEEGAYRDAWLWRISWLLALGFVLANSIAYAVQYRSEMTETRGLKIDAYERARQKEALATAEMSGLRMNPRWQATSGCSNATAEKSKAYCAMVHNAQAKIEEAEVQLTQGRPATKDAGAETLAWVLGVDEAKVRRSLPVFWSLILELMASLCMREAFATLRTPPFPGKTSPVPAMPEGRRGHALRARDTAMPGVPAFGMLTPVNSMRGQTPRGMLNDNMPIAAFA
jgi:hypothetical protein